MMSLKNQKGLWDLHIHGLAGIDFMNASERDMEKACSLLFKKGISVFTPTLLTDSEAGLIRALKNWGNFIERFRTEKPKKMAVPLGIHLEGPFLNPEKAGAHEKRYLVNPRLDLMKRFIVASSNHIAIVTLAPELKGAKALIQYLKKVGIRAQLGHSTATETQTKEALKWGAQGLTHAFNAMTYHHRDGGLLSALVHAPHTTSEIICDGIHVSESMVFLLAKAFPERIYAVSDGCPATLTKDGTTHKMGPLTLEKKGDAAYIAGTKTLAGSALLLPEHRKKILKKYHQNKALITSIFAPVNCLVLKRRLTQF